MGLGARRPEGAGADGDSPVADEKWEALGTRCVALSVRLPDLLTPSFPISSGFFHKSISKQTDRCSPAVHHTPVPPSLDAVWFYVLALVRSRAASLSLVQVP